MRAHCTKRQYRDAGLYPQQWWGVQRVRVERQWKGVTLGTLYVYGVVFYRTLSIDLHCTAGITVLPAFKLHKERLFLSLFKSLFTDL
jgi:hypothetical protein